MTAESEKGIAKDISFFSSYWISFVISTGKNILFFFFLQVAQRVKSNHLSAEVTFQSSGIKFKIYLACQFMYSQRQKFACLQCVAVDTGAG